MSSAFPSLTWDEAVREFLMHVEATRAPKTVRYHRIQLRQLTKWADASQVSIEQFGKRHMDRYLAARKAQGLRPLTVHHDAVCAKAFLTWCTKNDILERNPLSDYEVHAAPTPAKHMPTDDEMRSLLAGCISYWDVARCPAAKYHPVAQRVFHRDRNYAIVLGLIDSATRIGEMLALKVSDVRLKERQVVVRESKGKEPRTLPVSPEWAAALDSWLRVRAKVMAKAEQDDGWLFVTEYGGRIEVRVFQAALKRILEWSGVTKAVSLHSLRRFSINKLAKHNLLAAQQIAGHKESRTTLIYTQLDADFVRDMHEEVGVARGILGLRRETKRPRKLV